MLKKILTFLLIILALVQFSCEIKSEQALYEESMAINDPVKRVEALENFLAKYPENKNIDRVLSRLYRDFAVLGNENKAMEYAAQYLDFYPKDYRISQYNSVAWTLAENKMGLDSAKVYINRAVKQARENNLRNLNMILDTQAYVYFQAGDAQEALQIQQEAMAGNEDDYDYLSRLALYQHGAGEIETAYQTIAKSVLLGGGLETGKQLVSWLNEDYPDESNRMATAKRIAATAIKDFLEDEITIERKSQSTILFALLKTELDKALRWAQEAVNSLNDDSEFEQRLDFNINLAAVLIASEKFEDAMKTLVSVKDYASIYDVAYWQNLGKAYLKNNQKEKAIDAYINGMLWRKSDDFITALVDQGLSKDEIEGRIEKRKSELLSFHPGKFVKHEEYNGPVVLAELFTGAECPPCKGADLAMDLIAEHFPRTMVAILEYHLHIPGPDPLTNPDSEARYKYYGKNFGTPTAFFNGKGKLVGGGSELVKRDTFIKYKKSIETYFDKKALAKIDLSGKLNKGVIEVKCQAEFSPTVADNLTLNIAIVEKSVDYTGGNGITKHAFVVRYLLTGAAGEKVKLNGNTFVYSNEVELTEIGKRQLQYLADFENDPPKRFRNFSGWKEKKEKLNPEKIALVAWVQNDESKEIIQSSYSDFK